MKKQIQYLLALTMTLSTIIVYAQPMSIYLSGHVDSSITNRYQNYELTIKKNLTSNVFSTPETIDIALDKNGDFCTRIKLDNHWQYLSFWIQNKSLDYKTLSGLLPISFPSREFVFGQSEVYLFERGDNIHVDIFKGGFLRFKGNGSDKQNCAFQMYNIDPQPKTVRFRSTDLLNSGDVEAALDLQAKTLDLAIKTRMQILSSYKNKINPQPYKMLFLDAIGSAQLPWLNGLFAAALADSSKVSRLQLQKSFNVFCKQNNTLGIDSNIIAKSAYYPELLTQIAVSKYSLFNFSSDQIVRNPVAISAAFDIVKLDYLGILRDKLMLILNERLNNRFSSIGRQLFSEALSLTKDSQIIAALRKKEGGNSAFPFVLTDTKGVTHRMTDYKGKIVVIDVWFTGCSSCIGLNKSMEKVIEYYRNNKDIVFLTVNTDKDKEKWIKSINSGLYTNQGTINLYTDGLADQHPFIKYYNFRGAPQQLIIGKDQKIISARTPFGLEGPRFQQEFIKILEQHL
jgi:thiol-disulfide isomerase/thioredoxin